MHGAGLLMHNMVQCTKVALQHHAVGVMDAQGILVPETPFQDSESPSAEGYQQLAKDCKPLGHH